MGRLDISSFVEDLNKECKRLHNKYRINSGGCCWVSYILMRHFERLGIKVWLCIDNDYNYLDTDEFEYDLKNRNINSNATGLGENVCSHYFIQIPEIGPINPDISEEWLIYKVATSRDVKWIYDTGHWNHTFELRHRAIVGRRIKAIFDKHAVLLQGWRDSRSQ